MSPDPDETSGFDEQIDQEKPTAEELGKEAVDPAECPNCGREVEGTYCPDCGQKADPSVTATGVARDFVRELVDVEGGFRATLIGLTFRPSKVLMRYLRGARAGLMSPGRYLLASVVLSYGTRWVLVQTGAVLTPASYIDSTGTSGAEKRVAQVLVETTSQIYRSQWFGVGLTLITAGFFALILRRLLGEELTSGGEAIASSAFLFGHATILGTGVWLLLAPLIFLSTGRPVGFALQSAVPLLVTVLYVGTVVYRLRGDWTDTAKGTLGVIWVYVEAVAVTGLVILGYALWKITSSGLFSSSVAVDLGVGSLLYVLPLLLHAGVEAYYRLR